MSSTISTAIVSKLLDLHKERETAKANLLDLQKIQAETQEKRDALIELRDYSMQVAEYCQNRFETVISSIVTRCLSAVLGDQRYVFKIVFERKRNQAEARPVLVDADGNEYNPETMNGGGIVDVVAFGLRLACLILSRPQPSKILILDEPFQGLSAEYVQAMLSLMETLAEEFGVQIIMVTHERSYITGNVIEV